MRDATDMEHRRRAWRESHRQRKEEGAGGNAIDTEEEPGGDTTDTEGSGCESPHSNTRLTYLTLWTPYISSKGYTSIYMKGEEHRLLYLCTHFPPCQCPALATTDVPSALLHSPIALVTPPTIILVIPLLSHLKNPQTVPKTIQEKNSPKQTL